MELNREKCHNFNMAEKLGRCPLISVCNSDCVYVWKNLYDTQYERENEQEDIKELQEKISNLEYDLNSIKEDRDVVYSQAEDWEIKYNDMVDDLARVMNDDSIEKLCNYRDDGKVGEWAEDVCSRRITL